MEKGGNFLIFYQKMGVKGKKRIFYDRVGYDVTF